MLEKVRGRFSGFVSVGDEILKLPDFDEALFSLSGLLNFSVTVSGSNEDEALLIDAQMLTDEDSTHEVEKMLESVSSIKNIGRCQHNPKEVGSLLKRVILDKRGQYA